MERHRLIHDAAVAMATALIELFGNCLRDEEKQDAYWEAYHVCKNGIEAYLIQKHREEARLNPCRN
jgi:hypothetical protein